jgi:hypothetical protein
MRIRSIKPEFHSSFSIASLSEPAVILAVGLLNHADDRGYFEADPRIIKANIFPLREPSRSITGCLTELVRIEFIQLRKAPNSRLVGHVINFARHQVINKMGKTYSKAHVDFDKGTEALEFTHQSETETLPLPEGSGSAPGVLPEDSGKTPAGTGNREQGKGTGISSCPKSAPPPPDGHGGDESDSSEPDLPSSDGNKFVDWFLTLLAETGAPKLKLTPSIRAGWAQSYDRMIRLDGRTKDQIKEVCRWARQDKFWRSNFLSPVKLREKHEGVSYFDRFATKMNLPSTGGSGTKKPASVWDLQQRETAIKDKMRDLSEGHKGQKYVGLKPGSTNPYEWTPEGKAEYDRLQADLAAVRSQLAQRPDEDRQND